MSFILDALKKSELERQRQTTPGLMDPGAVPQRTGLPRWAIALGLLLAVNLVVLSVVLLRNGAPAGPSAPSAPPPSVANTATQTTAVHSPAPPPASPATAAYAASEPDHFSPLDAPAAAAADAPPVYAPEIPVEPAAETEPAPPPAHAPKAAHRDPLLTDDDGADDEVLPSMAELNLTGPDGLPELHIDVHVYATRPSERFVYINMRKYREGATLQEGPMLERIRRDGVVLNYHGVRFLLPRQ